MVVSVNPQCLIAQVQTLAITRRKVLIGWLESLSIDGPSVSGFRSPDIPKAKMPAIRPPIGKTVLIMIIRAPAAIPASLPCLDSHVFNYK